MFDTFTFKYLFWRRPSPLTPLPTLPAGVERFFVDTPGGKIEVLYAKPASTPNNAPPKTPLFFVHGGMGGAWVWLEYLTHLSRHGIPCYAVSMRGHGNSWHPSYLRMVYLTTKHMLAQDVVAAINFVQQREGGKEVVYIGHSSGGGLGQYILTEKMVKVKGLVLAAAVPGFGSMGVYINWWKLDPFFNIRMIFHGWHPNSPLSHPALTKRVFFSDQFPADKLLAFQKQANRYESFLWPVGMMRSFANPANILSQITSYYSGSSNRQSILVLAGGGDKIMTPTVMEDLAGMYRKAYYSGTKIQGEVSEVSSLDGKDTIGQGVRLCFVPGAGHHLQNDVGWEIGAEKLMAFYYQL
ncbi:putative Abhydrolase domain-containing protein [Podospora australis]|uniref:Abhydrolase domain-containing protein n=1 Tax=Podospora australis TaxID=1536484 RepID=A0AAN6X1B9_9PEZI|nr:putative Abhydrolase domain-containing protein [Podospora australis]